MTSSIFVVCVGNICTSPLGERALMQGMHKPNISLAGLGAVVGSGADETAFAVAAKSGVDLSEQVAL